jgi:hypothetical protein
MCVGTIVKPATRICLGFSSSRPNRLVMASLVEALSLVVGESLCHLVAGPSYTTILFLSH